MYMQSVKKRKGNNYTTYLMMENDFDHIDEFDGGDVVAIVLQQKDICISEVVA